MYYYFKGCLGTYDSVINLYDDIVIKTTNVIMYSFLLIGLLFFTIAVLFMLKLKQNQLVIYSDYRCLLWTAVIMMTLPLTFRCILDGMQNWQRWHDYIS